jgi:hypothetical protein
MPIVLTENSEGVSTVGETDTEYLGMIFESLESVIRSNLGRIHDFSLGQHGLIFSLFAYADKIMYDSSKLCELVECLCVFELLDTYMN